jgi:FixJ family two-component response regulator
MSTNSSQTAFIVIIDDDPFVRQATDGLLQSLGYRTAAFASAEDFLQSSYIHETTCLISDVQMPGLSGVDLQRMLIAKGNRTPMIFITAYFDERIRQSVMEAGAIGYLSKPFDEKSLIELLQSVHHRDDWGPRPKSWTLRKTHVKFLVRYIFGAEKRHGDGGASRGGLPLPMQRGEQDQHVNGCKNCRHSES